MIFRQRVNRVQPKMATQNYRTFAIRSPITTHYRKATCEEFWCEAYVNGWTLRVEGLDPALEHVAKNSGKHWNLVQVAEGETYMVFAAGQQCFAAHTHIVPLERPALFITGRGDWRSFTPRRAQVHKRPGDWVDDFQNHLDKLHREIEKG